MKPYSYILLLSILFISCKKSGLKHDEVSSVPDTGWKAIADIPGGARANATGFALNNKGYVCEGIYDFSGSHATGYNDMYMYNPGNNTWTKKSGLPLIDNDPINDGRRDPFSFVINGIAYAGGGISVNGEGGGDVNQYDPATDTWTFKAHKTAQTLLDGVNFGFSTATVANDKAYIYDYTEQEIWNYSPAANDLSFLKDNFQVINFNDDEWLAAKGDSVYYGSEQGSYFTIVNALNNTDVTNIVQSSTFYITGATACLSAYVYKNCIYISMGDEGSIYRFNLITNIWQTVIQHKFNITQGVASFMIGSKLYCVGGNNGVFSPATSKAWVIDLDAYPEN